MLEALGPGCGIQTSFIGIGAIGILSAWFSYTAPHGLAAPSCFDRPCLGAVVLGLMSFVERLAGAAWEENCAGL